MRELHEITTKEDIEEALNAMVARGFIDVTYTEQGEPLYEITELGKLAYEYNTALQENKIN